MLRLASSAVVAVVITIVACSAARAQQPQASPPILRVEPEAPSATVTSLRFSADGKTLFVAGWNKVVQVWQWDEERQQFVRNRNRTIRVPLGPGMFGAIEAMDLSADGRWLAVGGLGWSSSFAGFRESGYVWPPIMSDRMRAKLGAIYVFDTENGTTVPLQGHREHVRTIAFVSNDPRRLVSVASDGSGGQEVLVWSLDTPDRPAARLALPASLYPPSVVAWRTRGTDLRVAIGLAESLGGTPTPGIRLWNPATGAVRQHTPARVFGLELGGPPQQPSLLSASESGLAMHENFSQLSQHRRIEGTGAGIDLPLTLVPAVANGTPLVAAAVVRNANGLRDHGLVLFDPATRLVRGRRLSLWQHPTLTRPVLASGGPFFAVAGRPDFSVQIHRTASLAGGVAEPLQKIARQLVPASATFVKSRDRRGLLIRLAPRTERLAQDQTGQPGDIVLDVDSRKLAADPRQWTVANATPRQYTATLQADQSALQVTQARTGRTQVLRRPPTLRVPGRRVTAFALRDALDGNPPIAVVATQLQGEPFVEVWDLTTSSYVRQLTGHTRPVHSLVFSDDGRILLSASEDGTVRGWALQDLHSTTIGRIGWLQGLRVHDDAGQIRVGPVAAGTDAASTGLRENDAIVAVMNAGRPLELTRAWDLYGHISRTLPGATLPLRVRRNNATVNIQAPVTQGADERKALFSLALLGTPEKPEWLSWIPLGRFDASTRALEPMIGWHFNTGDPTAPTRFSSVQQLRDQFRHVNLLQALFDDGQIGFAPYLDPSLRVTAITSDDATVEPINGRELVLRDPRAQLLLETLDIRDEAVRTLEWSAGGRRFPFRSVQPGVWSSPLSEAALPYGRHTIDVTITSADDPPRQTSRQLILRLQPPAPKVSRVEPDAATLTTDSRDFVFRASVQTERPAIAKLEQLSSDAPDASWEFQLTSSGPIQQTLTLLPGPNRLRLTVRNRDMIPGLAEFADAETTVLENTIIRQTNEPPELRLLAIVDGNGQPVEPTDGVFTSTTPRVSLHARVHASQAVTTVNLQSADVSTPLRIPEDNPTDFPLHEQVILQPGENKVTLAAAMGPRKSHLVARIRYVPQVPSIQLVEPHEKVVRIPATTRPGIQLPIRAAVSASEHPWTPTLRLDGQPLSNLTLTVEDGELSTSVPLVPDANSRPDEHVITVQLRNQWGAAVDTGLTVRLLHTPVIESMTFRQPRPDAALGELSARIRTPSNRPITSVRVSVDGKTVNSATAQPDAESGLYVIRDVPLADRTSKVTIVAVNTDGPSESRSVQATITAPPRPPVVVIRQPRPDAHLSVAGTTLVATVAASGRLSRAMLILSRDGRPDERHVLSADELAEVADTGTLRRNIRLEPGINRITLEVLGDSGATSRSTSVSHVPPPLSIQLVELQPTGGGAPAIPRPGTTSVRFNRALSSGQATLRGRIVWLPGHRPPGKLWMLQLWTNGFLRPLPLAAGQARENQLEFELPVVLNRTTNRLRIDAASLPVDEATRAQLSDIRVDCTSPESDQDLHLVMVGVEMNDGQNVADPRTLRTLATKALRLHAKDSAFRRVHEYGPLTGADATAREVQKTLIRLAVRLRDRTRRPNDVVMLYYRGREHATADGHVILEDATNWPNPTAYGASLTEESLASLFRHLPGAHVVLLDVDADVQPEAESFVERWPRYPNLGMFRVSWPDRQVPVAADRTLLALLETAIAAAGRNSGNGEIPLVSVESEVRKSSLAEAGPARRGFAAIIPADLADLIVGRLTDPE